jgi:hypothetical protein
MFTSIDGIPPEFEVGMALDREFAAQNPDRRHWVRPATDAEIELMRKEEVLSIAGHDAFVWQIMVCQIAPGIRLKTLFCGFIPAGANTEEEEARRLCFFLTGVAA